jgi:hypothetical protein
MAHQTALLPRERLAHLAKRIHALGARPLLECFLELQAGKPFNDTLEAYARLEVYADFIAAHGGRELAQARLVPRRRA